MQHIGARLRILIADDSDLIRLAVVRLLGDAFEIVGVVCSGEALVDAVRTLDPDVIVSDLDMPALTGAGALKVLRAAGNTTPFVLMTATVHNPRRWIELGALGVVDKLDLHAELADALRSAAAGEIYISRSALIKGSATS